MNTLYLGSQSVARHTLLRQAHIPFTIIPVSVCEEEHVVTGTVQEQVSALAEFKHTGIEVANVVAEYQPPIDTPLFFLTADSLIQGCDNKRIYGKPRDRAHAVEMIREIATQEIIISTGMCLSVWHYNEAQAWHCAAHEVWHADAYSGFRVSGDDIDEYLEKCPTAMLACGATVIEEIGIRSFTHLKGSYTGALGIDLYTLHQQLKRFGFYM